MEKESVTQEIEDLAMGLAEMLKEEEISLAKLLEATSQFPSAGQVAVPAPACQSGPAFAGCSCAQRNAMAVQ